MRAALLPLLVARVVATEEPCERIVRYGTFPGVAPSAAAATTQYFDGNGDCIVYMWQPSGPEALARLESGDLDIATIGTVPATSAVERGALVTGVLLMQMAGASEALVTRDELYKPQDLRGKTILTPHGSTPHFMLQAFLVETNIFPQDINIEFAPVHEILRRWDAGEIDGAACWTHCVEHMLTRPPGGVGLPGQVMVDAATTGDWGYPHGGALVVRNDWLAENRAVVTRFVERIARMNYDYVMNTRAPGWDADGRYVDAIGRYFTRSFGNESTFPGRTVVKMLKNNEYPSLAEQLDWTSTASVFNYGPTTANFLWAQKELAEPPFDSFPAYAAKLDPTFVLLARHVDVPLDREPDALPLAKPNAIREQLPVDGESCAALTVLDVDGNGTAFDDGSTGTNAYHADATCVWALKSSTGCVSLEVPFLSSEAPRDRLEVFSAAGDLVASFTGRRRDAPARPTVQGCADEKAPEFLDAPRAALYVVWSTDEYDERAFGAIEPVGFRAVARVSRQRRPPVTSCPPGRAGAGCESSFCNGVVDVEGESGVIRSQEGTDAYAPYSKCGWRIPARGRHVVLDVATLGTELVYDKLRIYLFHFAPAGFGLAPPSSLADRTRAYQLSGTTPPAGSLIFDVDVFVTFESDGFANRPRELGPPAGFEIRWRLDGSEGSDDGLCPGLASCGANARCVDGACVCDPGYYGSTCIFHECTGAIRLDKASSGRIVSGVSGDYSAANWCGWGLTIPGRDATPLAGLRLRFDKFNIEATEEFTVTSDIVGLLRTEVFGRGPPVLIERLAGFSRRTFPQSAGPVGVVTDLDTSAVRQTFAEGQTLVAEFSSPGAAGEDCSLMLSFETDANNYRNFSGFDVSYAPYYGPGHAPFCDASWPCEDASTSCEEDRCVASGGGSHKSRKGLRRFKRGAMIFGIVLACLIGAGLIIGGAIAWRREVQAKKKLEAQKGEIDEDRIRVVREQVGAARRWVEDFQAPFAVVAGDTFVALGELRPHEALRGEGKLRFYDSVQGVEDAQARGDRFVFLSHQWLGTSHPDPSGLHYEAMCAALRAVAARADVELASVHAWVDVASIPQANPGTQQLAVASLPTFSSCVDYFIVVAPASLHDDTGVPCDEITYRRRTWCRAEVIACWARKGPDRMFVSTSGEGLRPLLDEDGVLDECLDVFGGDLTCCRLGHPCGTPCDREALAFPVLGLVAELYRDRRERPEAWALISDRLDELFPRNFVYYDRTKTPPTLPLFGDLVAAAMATVDAAEDPDDVASESLRDALRGLAPGTNCQRHVEQRTSSSSLGSASPKTPSVRGPARMTPLQRLRSGRDSPVELHEMLTPERKTPLSVSSTALGAKHLSWAQNEVQRYDTKEDGSVVASP